MKKLAKFFNKVSPDKFPDDSEGRRLNEPKPDKTPKQSRPESPPSIPRSPPSQEAMRAADAALSRLAAKDIPRKTAIQRKVEAENAEMRKQALAAEQIAAQFSKMTVASDTGGALKKVTFSCPSLLDDKFSGSYSEVDTKIEKTLLEEAENDPASAYTLLIIRSIQSSPFPIDVNPSSENAPSIQEIRDKRRNNFATIIRNLVEHPEKENFRRLRTSNKLISDLLQLRFAQQFFETCGFIETEEPMNSEEGTFTMKFLVFPTAPSEEQLFRLKEMLDLLKSGDLIVPILCRNTTVLQASGGDVRELAHNELPPEFFQISLDDYRRMKEQLQRESQDKVLLTRATRERIKNLNRRVFRYTLIRVRLPQGNLLVQGTFAASETVHDIRKWLSECLSDASIEYSLYAPPGIVSTTSSNRPASARVSLDDCESNATLFELNLTPSAVLTLSLSPSMPPSTIVRLLPELEEQIIPL
ncbi:hypothetical protein Aperf_G00000091482 [Anoplocephala perfoliata]